MSRRIYKYKLTNVGENIIHLPSHSRILSVINQNEAVTVYAEVYNTDTKTKPIKIYVCQTGDETPKGASVFLGTVVLARGSYILHVYLKDSDYLWDGQNCTKITV